MKFCGQCGNSLEDSANFCNRCGTAQQGYIPQQPYAYAPRESGLATAAKILMIISTVIYGLYILPLAWCLPMTIYYHKQLKQHLPVSVGFKICTLLFVNMISGILMLCDDTQ